MGSWLRHVGIFCLDGSRCKCVGCGRLESGVGLAKHDECKRIKWLGRSWFYQHICDLLLHFLTNWFQAFVCHRQRSLEQQREQRRSRKWLGCGRASTQARKPRMGFTHPNTITCQHRNGSMGPTKAEATSFDCQ